jgi:hypothetical protein
VIAADIFLGLILERSCFGSALLENPVPAVATALFEDFWKGVSEEPMNPGEGFVRAWPQRGICFQEPQG